MTTKARPGLLAILLSAALLCGCATGGDGLLPVVAGGDPADDLLPVVPGGDDDLLPVVPGDDDLLPVEVDPEPDTPECLQGIWLLDNASYRALLQPLAQSSGGSVRSLTGQVVVTFGAGDTFESLYDDWTIITDTAEGSATIERNGVDAGAVRYRTASFTLVEEQSGSTVEGFVTTPSGTIPLPSVGSSAELIAESAGYRCAGDSMTLSLSSGELSFLRL